VQVEFSAAPGVRPDWTFCVPNKRSYPRMLRDYDGAMLSFDRPVADGRALAVSSAAREVIISASSKSPGARPAVRALVQSTRRWRGSWPERLAGDADSYPAEVFQGGGP